LTFGEFAEQWLSQRELKPRTHAHYRTILDKFLLPEFAERDLTAITAADVRNWHARVTTGKPTGCMPTVCCPPSCGLRSMTDSSQPPRA
jgi:hypothetical protein